MLLFSGCGEREIYARQLGKGPVPHCLKAEKGDPYAGIYEAILSHRFKSGGECAFRVVTHIDFATCSAEKRPAGSALGVMRLEVLNGSGAAVYQIQQEFDREPTSGQAGFLLEDMLNRFTRQAH